MWEGAVTMPQIGNSSTCVCFVIKRMEVEGVQPAEVSIPWLPQEQESNGKRRSLWRATSILGFKAALEGTSSGRLWAVKRRGAWLRPARLIQRPALVRRQGAGRPRGGAVPRSPAIGCWGGERRLGGAGPASGLRALAGGAAGDTWCGTGAVSRRSAGLPSAKGAGGRGGLSMRPGGAGVRLVCKKVRDPGHPAGSGGGREVPDL